jgi:hypothetical protein
MTALSGTAKSRSIVLSARLPSSLVGRRVRVFVLPYARARAGLRRGSRLRRPGAAQALRSVMGSFKGLLSTSREYAARKAAEKALER